MPKSISRRGRAAQLVVQQFPGKRDNGLELRYIERRQPREYMPTSLGAHENDVKRPIC
jgi:hypothetical protein